MIENQPKKRDGGLNFWLIILLLGNALFVLGNVLFVVSQIWADADLLFSP
jgi:hypothetical protein